jgi:hypothetical protein
MFGVIKESGIAAIFTNDRHSLNSNIAAIPLSSSHYFSVVIASEAKQFSI